MLMKSAPVDQKSEAIIAKRDAKAQARRKVVRVEKIVEIAKRNIQITKSKRPRRPASARGRAKALKAKQDALDLIELIGSESD